MRIAGIFEDDIPVDSLLEPHAWVLVRTEHQSPDQAVRVMFVSNNTVSKTSPSGVPQDVGSLREGTILLNRVAAVRRKVASVK